MELKKEIYTLDVQNIFFANILYLFYGILNGCHPFIAIKTK